MRRLVAVLGLVAGCGGGRVAADVAWTAEKPKEAGPRQTEYLTEGPTTLTDPDGGPSRALLGVRPDVRIAAQAKPTATCACLAVVVAGSPSDAKLAWHSSVPEVTEDSMAVAISARGVECPGGAADETKRRASISAVDRDGEDVIIEIEDLPDGRPIALGAIIPKPGKTGSIFVRPRHKDVPYGRVPANAPLCKIN